MAANIGKAAVLTMGEALELYYDLLQQSKGMEQQVRLLRDRILQAIASLKTDRVLIDGYEAERQLRHHPPQINEDQATRVLEAHGRLQECQTEVLDLEKAREVIEELLRHGAITKDELPYVHVKPTAALVVRHLALPEAAEEVRRAA